MSHFFLRRTPVGNRGVRQECAEWLRELSSILNPEASVLIDLTSKSAKKLLVEPSVTVSSVLLKKRSQTQSTIVLRRTPVGGPGVRKELLSELRGHSSISKSEGTVLIGLTTKSATKLMVEPPAAVGTVLLERGSQIFSQDTRERSRCAKPVVHGRPLPVVHRWTSIGWPLPVVHGCRGSRSGQRI